MNQNKEAFKNLASALLLSVFIDIDKGYFDMDFVDSQFAENVCYLAETPYINFKSKAYEEAYKKKAKLGELPFDKL